MMSSLLVELNHAALATDNQGLGKPGMQILDVGANIGTLHLAYVPPKGRGRKSFRF